MDAQMLTMIKNELDFDLLFEHHPYPLWIHRQQDLALISTNAALENLLGFEHKELQQMTLRDLLFVEDLPRFESLIQSPEITGRLPGAWHLTCKNGTLLRVALDLQPLESQNGIIWGTFTEEPAPSAEKNILEARVRLSKYAFDHTLDELLQKTLDEAERLTNSQIGFFHFVEADQRTLWLQTWSTNTLQSMCTAAGKFSHYSIEKAGVWVDCLHQRRPVIHNDYASLPHRKGLPPGHAAIQRELVIPVIRNDVVVAILGVGNKPEEYDAADVVTVNLLADLAWDITGKKRAEDELIESEKKFHGIFKQSPVAIEIFDAEGRLIDANPACLEMFGVPSLEHVLGFRLFEDPNIPEDALASLARGETVSYEKLFNFDLVKENHLYPTSRSGNFAINCMIHPLGEQGQKNTGYLVHIRDITTRQQAEKDLLETHTALEQANKELHQALAREKNLARTDSLTGIYNRRHFFEMAAHEFQVARRYNNPLAVIMFDIDNFKGINDAFGHQIGDEVLKQVAQTTSQHLRDVDILARYGGEEFTVLLPNCTAKEAAQVAHRFQEEIARINIPTTQGPATATVSVGITEYQPEIETLDELMHQADLAMYAAKNSGRNRSVTFSRD